MRYRLLGRTGLYVSELCLGTMTFGGQGFWKVMGGLEQDAATALVKQAFDAGVNFIDTANVYSLGESETITGQAIRSLGLPRDELVIATKATGVMNESAINAQGQSRYHLMNQLNASLKRLQTDYIDLYQMHHIDRSTPWEEVWQAMDVLVTQGKILYVGSSNFGGWHIAQAQEAAKSRHFMGLVSEQSIYNLVTRDIEREVIPAALHYGLGVIPWSPLHGGLLGGILKKQDSKRRLEGRSKEFFDAKRPQIERYEAFCDSIGHAPADVALGWLLAQPAVTAPIIGPRTQEQLTNSLKALEVNLTAEQLAALNEIFPGYKTAPEDYAW